MPTIISLPNRFITTNLPSLKHRRITCLPQSIILPLFLLFLSGCTGGPVSCLLFDDCGDPPPPPPPVYSRTISFSPVSTCTGGSLTITDQTYGYGYSFDPVKENNAVFFLGDTGNPADDKKGVVTAVSYNQMKVTIPEGTVTGPIRVESPLDFGLGVGNSTTTFMSLPCTLKNIQNISNNIRTSYNPSMAASGDTVITAWVDETPGNIDILMARSTDGGRSFSPPINVSNNLGASYNPSVAISNNTVIVAWEDFIAGVGEGSNILLAQSTDGGRTFSLPINISKNTATSGSVSLLSTPPSVAISGSTVIAVWAYSSALGNRDIQMARSLDGGATFFDPVNLSNNTGGSESPVVAILENTVIVAWHDDTPGNLEILMARSTDSGQSFATSTNLSNSKGVSYNPSVAISGNTVIAGWQDYTPGNADIFIARSTNLGETFGISTNLSNSKTDSYHPSVAISQNIAVSAWEEEEDSHGGIGYPPTYTVHPIGYSSLFVAGSIDGGEHFGAPIDSTIPTGFSRHPLIIMGIAVLFAWEEYILGSAPDIFVARLE